MDCPPGHIKVAVLEMWPLWRGRGYQLVEVRLHKQLIECMSLMTQNRLENSERAGRLKSTYVLATIAN